MCEVRSDVKANFLETAAGKYLQMARNYVSQGDENAETDGLLLNLAKNLNALLMFRDADAAFEVAENAWREAGVGCEQEVERVEDIRRTLKIRTDTLGGVIADNIWEMSAATDLNPVNARLVICEAERRAAGGPVEQLADRFAKDPELSKPGTWNGEEFPWVKTDD